MSRSELLLWILSLSLCLRLVLRSYSRPIFYCTRSGRVSVWRIHVRCTLWAKNNIITRMCANAQRDGRPAEYRWRPLFNTAKFGWRPLLECLSVTLSRRETRWHLLGCPKFANRFQPLVGQSSPYCKDMRRIYFCLATVFRLSIFCLSCEDIAGQRCAMVSRWRFFGDFCVLYLQRAACSTFQICILNLH